MHNVNVEAVERTADQAGAEPSSVVQRVVFAGDWQTSEGAPQFPRGDPGPERRAGRLRGRLPAADGRDGIGAQSARLLLLGRARVPPLLLDEPEPLGDGDGPNAAKVLAAAVGNCLSASALYCLRRARIDVQSMRTTVSASLSRNEAGRLRV